MPPALRSSYPPLDVEKARAAVESGRTVRVGILPTHQFPEGGAGRIKAVGSTDTDGSEFIQVEVTVGGAKDVVPFAPTDLSPITRGQTAPVPVAAAGARRSRLRTAVTAVSTPPRRGASTPPARPNAETGLFEGAVAVGGPTGAATTGTAGAATAGAGTAGAAITGAGTAATETAGAGTAGTGTAAVAGSTAPSDRSAPAAVTRKTTRGKRQPISVTLATIDPDHTSWQVEVTVGSRVVVKPSPIHPAQAWALVTDLGHPEVARVVAGALNEHRQQAQERADRLARELAEAQADLANYPSF